MKQDKEKNRRENEYLISIITKKYEDELAEKDKEITRLRVEVEALRSGQKHLASKKASISVIHSLSILYASFAAFKLSNFI